MSFFRQARQAGAMEYGRTHAEKYARRAKVARFVVVTGILVPGTPVVLAARGGLGG